MVENAATLDKDSHSQREVSPVDSLPGVIQLSPCPEQELMRRIAQRKQALWGLQCACEAQCRSIAAMLRESPTIRGLWTRKPKNRERTWITAMVRQLDRHQSLELNVLQGVRSISWSKIVNAGCNQVRASIARRLQIEAEGWLRTAARHWQLEINPFPRMISGATGETRTR